MNIWLYLYLSFSVEYHMYQLNPLHSSDYLKKISIKINVATAKGNSWKEMWHWTNDETVHGCLWVRVELMAW